MLCSQLLETALSLRWGRISRSSAAPGGPVTMSHDSHLNDPRAWNVPVALARACLVPGTLGGPQGVVAVERSPPSLPGPSAHVTPGKRRGRERTSRGGAPHPAWRMGTRPDSALRGGVGLSAEQQFSLVSFPGATGVVAQSLPDGAGLPNVIICELVTDNVTL